MSKLKLEKNKDVFVMQVNRSDMHVDAEDPSKYNIFLDVDDLEDFEDAVYLLLIEDAKESLAQMHYKEAKGWSL